MIWGRAVLTKPDLFFFVEDSPQGPPSADRHQPPSANRHQPPSANRHQPPPTANCHQPPAANLSHDHKPESVPVNIRFCSRYFFCFFPVRTALIGGMEGICATIKLGVVCGLCGLPPQRRQWLHVGDVKRQCRGGGLKISCTKRVRQQCTSAQQFNSAQVDAGLSTLSGTSSAICSDCFHAVNELFFKV